MVVSWTVGGAIAFGGVIVGVLTVSGMVSPGFHLLAAPVLFLLGALLGGVHGAVLAVVGRPRTLERGGAFRKALWAVLVAVPALFPAWIVTAGISLSAALVKEWHLWWAILTLGGWVSGLAVCAWATREGWRAIRRAYARWPESRAGSVLTALILVVACFASLRMEPELWGTGLKLNGVGALILALAATLWVGFPLVWVTLRIVHEYRHPRHVEPSHLTHVRPCEEQRMERSARNRPPGLLPLAVALALCVSACAEEPADEGPDPAAGTATVAAAATTDQDAEAPVRRWLPDEMSRSTRVENFPHVAHVEISCRVCHAAPQGHQMHSTLPCSECHRSSALVTRQSLTRSECLACHHDPQRNVSCARCHTPPGPRTVQRTFQMSVWATPRTKALPYDHARHTAVECRTCHTQPTHMTDVPTCASCHERHHTPAARCQTCHTQPPAGAHNAQAHLGCLGSGCHNAPDVNAISGRRAVCLVCHQTQENHEPGKECADCHQVRPGRDVEASAYSHDPQGDGKAGQW